MVSLNNENRKRFLGEFYTPLNFAQKGLEYIEKILGKNLFDSGQYRLWDMAAGTGNLEYYLPTEAQKYCYLSTIQQQEFEICKQNFPEATCFQYDYLNDDVENLFFNIEQKTWKLPENLRKDLENSELKWLILINPPYATSQKANGKFKEGVSDTKIRKFMHIKNLGEDSRELYVQFLFRIHKEFENKNVILSLFSKINFINANNHQKFREKIFHFIFEKGFIFSSANFSETSKNNAFPVCFSIWNFNKNENLQNQTINFDILNEKTEKIGTKILKTEDKNKFLNHWVQRPAAKIIFPPLGSAITLKIDNKDKRDRIAKAFIASMMCAGNTLQNQNQTAIFSAPAASAGAFSITFENFEKSIIIFAVRNALKKDWLNCGDQLLQPNKGISDEFICDSVIFSLFNPSNQTAALRNVEYKNQIYQINNQFFPFLLSEIRSWNVSESKIKNSFAKDTDRFVAKWLLSRKLSVESEKVFEKGREIYQYFFENLKKLNLELFKIESWDVGWWQIRNCLKKNKISKSLFCEMKVFYSELREKIASQIEKYGFLQ